MMPFCGLPNGQVLSLQVHQRPQHIFLAVVQSATVGLPHIGSWHTVRKTKNRTLQKYFDVNPGVSFDPDLVFRLTPAQLNPNTT
jgi:hypothetical protein